MEAPSPFCLSSDIFPPIHDSTRPTLQKAVAFLFSEIQIYIQTSQTDFVGVQNGLIDIQLNSEDQLKRGPLTPPPSCLLSKKGELISYQLCLPLS